MRKAKEIEEFYNEKKDNSLYYLRDECRNLHLKKENEEENKQIDEIDNLPDDLVSSLLEKLIADAKR